MGHRAVPLPEVPSRSRVARCVLYERALSGLRPAVRARDGVLDGGDGRELRARHSRARAPRSRGLARERLGHPGRPRRRGRPLPRNRPVRLALLPCRVAASRLADRPGPGLAITLNVTTMPAWTPSAAYLDRSRLRAFAMKNGCPDYAALLRWS